MAFNFEKLRDAVKRPSFTWRYRCQRCKRDVEFVQRMPAHLLSHTGFDVYPRCGGRLVLVSATPDDPTLERCPACLDAGRHDPAKGVGWVNPACQTCRGDGAVARGVPT